MTLIGFAAAVTNRLDLFAAEPGSGILTCDLSQWKWLVFNYIDPKTKAGRTVTITMDEVFPALEEYFGSTPTSKR
jgi:hypothetical protein